MHTAPVIDHLFGASASAVKSDSSCYRARYYDPSTGRFISEDPTGFNAEINFYSYGRNNPIFYGDPLGLDVTVTIYSGLNGNPFGHAGISVNGSPAVGFNPTCDTCAVGTALLSVAGIGAALTDGSVKGAVLPIDPRRVPSQTIQIKTTPEQDARILGLIDSRTKDPGAYNLLRRNCAHFVQSALGAAGIPSSRSPLPGALGNSLAPPPSPLPSRPKLCGGFTCLDNR